MIDDSNAVSSAQDAAEDTGELHFYLVFYADDGNREDCSVYYSVLVKARNKATAIELGNAHHFQVDNPTKHLDAEKMTVIE